MWVHCPAQWPIAIPQQNRVPLTDTWAYDPATGAWQAMTPPTAPPASEGPLAYDDKADLIIYVATLDGMTFGPLSETWAYDYNSDTWAQLTTNQTPSPGMVGGRMVYDSESDRLIFFGGYDIPHNGYFNETWVFDLAAKSWTQMAPAVAPPGTNFQSMVYDSAADRVLMWGSVSDDRLWSYDYNNDTWAEVTDTGTPPLMDYTRMVYIPALQQSILFGGVDVPNEVPQGGTWVFDHLTQAWQQLTLPTAPEPRAWQAMVYEPTTGQLLLFGGGADRDHAYGDLWRFDPVAQSWAEITPVEVPATAVAPAEVGYFLTGADKRNGSAFGPHRAIHPRRLKLLQMPTRPITMTFAARLSYTVRQNAPTVNSHPTLICWPYAWARMSRASMR